MLTVTVDATTGDGSAVITIVNDITLELLETFTVSVMANDDFPVIISEEDSLMISIMDDEGSSKQLMIVQYQAHSITV